MKHNVAIIGAGASGRGFIARMLKQDGAQITFIDTNRKLIDRLNAAGSYQIYMGCEKKPMCMDGYSAFAIDAPEALSAAAQADYIFVSIGEQNLHNLNDFFRELAKQRSEYRVVVCENGIEPKVVLRSALDESFRDQFKITQGVIFCTTIPCGEIDILSEDYDEMPYDTDEDLFELPFAHFKAQRQFKVLLQRKIYTYNCLSACIAYTGYLKGYTDYAAAANDPQIYELCQALGKKLTTVVSKAFDIAYEEQEAFTQRALKKFTNSAITDTITKNARSTIRKLSSNERLAGPIYLFSRMGEDTEILCFVVACAFVYLRKEEMDNLRENGYLRPMDLFLHGNANMSGEILARIEADYEDILNDHRIEEVIAALIERVG